MQDEIAELSETICWWEGSTEPSAEQRTRFLRGLSLQDEARCLPLHEHAQQQLLQSKSEGKDHGFEMSFYASFFRFS